MSVHSAARNSTNVRTESPLDPWPPRSAPRRAPGAALVLWGLFVAAASLDGVFGRLEPQAYGALALFAVTFTALCFALDRDVRDVIAATSHPVRLALAADAAIAATWSAMPAGAPWTAWAQFPGAVALLVVLPLALALHAVTARGAVVRKAPGASPGATPAAT
ncbi:MAG TPA: hypothetical protein VFE23_17360 [Usitatibacter sp.]|jgi:hypothetical protein|nr:hypothetical protein [Usitatibacter sp.]